jgi:hypothetical protein
MARRQIITRDIEAAPEDFDLGSLFENFTDSDVPVDPTLLFDDLEEDRNIKREKYRKFMAAKKRANQLFKDDPIRAPNRAYLERMYPIWYVWHDPAYTEATVKLDMSMKASKSKAVEEMYLKLLDSKLGESSQVSYGLGDVSQETGISVDQLRMFFKKGVFLTKKTTFQAFEFFLYSDAIIYAYEYREVLRVCRRSSLLSYITLYVKANYKKYQSKYKEEGVAEYVRSRIGES